MRVLITGVCGFVGSSLARIFREHRPVERLEIVGLDNLCRPGSETNRQMLAGLGVDFVHGDVRIPSDLESVGHVDWVIDAAANPSVLAGLDGRTSSRQLLEHNLGGTINLLELCKAHRAGFILLSTSRVYSIPPLAALPVEVVGSRFRAMGEWAGGIREEFSTAAPVSLYGASKVASEMLALEYYHCFDLPVWVNRCGVLAGAGQFGHPAQGIFAYWVNAHLQRQRLRYIGFEGSGHQVRDALHPRDLAELLLRQMEVAGPDPRPRTVNVAGGLESSMSLAELHAWCGDRFGAWDVERESAPRPFDIPWMVLDSARARAAWDWAPQMTLPQILEEIAEHAGQHPGWLELSRA